MDQMKLTADMTPSGLADLLDQETARRFGIITVDTAADPVHCPHCNDVADIDEVWGWPGEYRVRFRCFHCMVVEDRFITDEAAEIIDTDYAADWHREDWID